MRDDLVVLLLHLVEYFDRPEVRRMFPSFLDAAVRDPELAELRQETMRGVGPASSRSFDRGIERGELPADVDVGLFIDVVRARRSSTAASSREHR